MGFSWRRERGNSFAIAVSSKSTSDGGVSTAGAGAGEAGRVSWSLVDTTGREEWETGRSTKKQHMRSEER